MATTASRCRLTWNGTHENGTSDRPGSATSIRQPVDLPLGGSARDGDARHRSPNSVPGTSSSREQGRGAAFCTGLPQPVIQRTSKEAGRVVLSGDLSRTLITSARL